MPRVQRRVEQAEHGKRQQRVPPAARPSLHLGCRAYPAAIRRAGDERPRSRRRNGYKGRIDSLRGQLLIAGATLPDPNFARTVVLVCEHCDGRRARPRAQPPRRARRRRVGARARRPDRRRRGHRQRRARAARRAARARRVRGPRRRPASTSSRTSASSATAARSTTSSTRRCARASSPATRAGARDSSTPSSSARTGSSRRPGSTTSSTPTPTSCGAASSTRKGAHFALVARMPIDPSVN